MSFFEGVRSKGFAEYQVANPGFARDTSVQKGVSPRRAVPESMPDLIRRSGGEISPDGRISKAAPKPHARVAKKAQTTTAAQTGQSAIAESKPKRPVRSSIVREPAVYDLPPIAIGRLLSRKQGADFRSFHRRTIEQFDGRPDARVLAIGEMFVEFISPKVMAAALADKHSELTRHATKSQRRKEVARSVAGRINELVFDLHKDQVGVINGVALQEASDLWSRRYELPGTGGSAVMEQVAVEQSIFAVEPPLWVPHEFDTAEQVVIGHNQLGFALPDSDGSLRTARSVLIDAMCGSFGLKAAYFASEQEREFTVPIVEFDRPLAQLSQVPELSAFPTPIPLQAPHAYVR